MGSILMASLPNALTHYSTRCVAFRMLSRRGCVAHEILVRLTDEPRIRLFKLTHNRSLAANTHATPKCLLRNFAKGFLEARLRGELAGDDGHHRLLLIVASANLETVGTEHGHSKPWRKVAG